MQKIYYESVGRIETEDETVFETYLNKVNEQRRKKVDACKQKKDKMRSLMAGLLLRKALENEGIDYAKAEFSVLESGKPYLVSHPDIHFSLSHAGDYVVCVVSDVPIGVDIECKSKSLFKKENAHRWNTVAKRCLAPLEWERFSQSSVKQQLFLEYWTKKEAYSKWIGKGLGMDFTTIDTESQKTGFCTEWLDDEYCVSIYSKRK